MIESLREFWSKQGIHIRPGASSEQIERFRSKYQVHLPSDFRRYLATIDAIKSVPEELATFGGVPNYTAIMRSLADPHHWFVFVDYLIMSAVYAIRLFSGDESTPVLWIGDGTRHRVVAESFSVFVEAYLSNSDNLL